jgi:hypothetical protein
LLLLAIVHFSFNTNSPCFVVSFLIIELWNRTRYSYHGECDLVLLQNEDFADGLGMDIHIRTTQQSFYSYIESAALRIGNDILEVTGTDFWINGVQGSDADLPTTIGGFQFHFPTYSPSGKAKFYQVDLNNGDNVLIRSYSHFMSVDVLGRSRDFGTATGLMGNYYSSEMLGRDGKTVIQDSDVFGSEWQVHADEAELFRTAREPQHPHAACNMPDTIKQSRHLRQESEALFVTLSFVSMTCWPPRILAWRKLGKNTKHLGSYLCGDIYSCDVVLCHL